MTKWRIAIVLAVLGPNLGGCSHFFTTVSLDPPARETVGHLEFEVARVTTTHDIMFERVEETSRLAVWVDVENRDVIPARVDLGQAHIVARVAGLPDEILRPLASGWDALPDEVPDSRALPIELGPRQHRRAWIVFSVPNATTRDPPRAPALDLMVEGDDGVASLVVANPTAGRPRWFRSVAGPLRLGVSSAGLAGPDVVGGAVHMRASMTLGSRPLHFWWGPAALRHDGHALVGAAAGLQVDLPPRAWPSSRLRLTPFIALETVIVRGSFRDSDPWSEAALIGPSAGVEIGFGSLQPRNADVFPISYDAPLSPFSIRLACVRWWGDVGGDSIDRQGRFGASLTLTVSFGP